MTWQQLILPTLVAIKQVHALTMAKPQVWGPQVLSTTLDYVIATVDVMNACGVVLGVILTHHHRDEQENDMLLLLVWVVLMLTTFISFLINQEVSGAFIRRVVFVMYSPFLPLTITTTIVLTATVLFGQACQDGAIMWRRQQPRQRHHHQQPLNVLVLSIGTRGDVQPFLTLGQELKSRGHNVTVCGFGKHRGLVERYGLAFLDSGIPEIVQETVSWRRATHVSEVMELSLPDFSLNFLKLGSAFYAAAVDTNADVLIATSTTQSFVLSIAEKLNRRAIVVKLAPDLPTRNFPAPGYHAHHYIGIFNYMTWLHHWILIAKAASNAGMGPAEEAFRKKVLEIPPLARGKRLKEMGECATLCAFSKTVVPSPRDWSGNALVTGWWFASGAKPIKPRPLPDNVAQFLGTDSAVICVTFGSMSPAADASGLVQLVAEAVVAKYGKDQVRLFIIRPTDDGTTTPNGNAKEDYGGLKVLCVDEAPHDVVFPRCRVVIHHGGAGTCASVLESGIPAVIIPVLLWTDQPLWGELLQGLGVAVKVDQEFAQLDTNAAKLDAARIKFVHDVQMALAETETIACKERCGAVAKLVGEERGVQDACDALENLVMDE